MAGWPTVSFACANRAAVLRSKVWCWMACYAIIAVFVGGFALGPDGMLYAEIGEL